MNSNILIYSQKYVKHINSIVTHIKNPFLWLPFKFVSFIDNSTPKDSFVLFFDTCYTSEQYFEFNKVCIKNNLSIIDWTEDLLIVVKSTNKNINKNLISNLRKEYNG